MQQDCKGFLITCDQNKEKQAIKDAYNFLNQFIEKIYDDLEEKTMMETIKAEGKQHSLQAQLQQVKKVQNRILFSVDTNVKCLVFIKINPKYNIIDPNKIVLALMEDMHEHNRLLTRYCHKILPVQRAFKAQFFKMLDVVQQLFASRDNTKVKSWALNFKCRNNSKFNYKQVLKKIEEIAKKYGHFVDIYYPQWTVSVQITKHLMCVGITEKYKQFQQFKLKRKPFQFTPQEKQEYQLRKDKKMEEKSKQVKNTKKQKVKQHQIKETQQKQQKGQQQNEEQIEKMRQALIQQQIGRKEDDVDFL